MICQRQPIRSRYSNKRCTRQSRSRLAGVDSADAERRRTDVAVRGAAMWYSYKHKSPRPSDHYTYHLHGMRRGLLRGPCEPTSVPLGDWRHWWLLDTFAGRNVAHLIHNVYNAHDTTAQQPQIPSCSPFSDLARAGAHSSSTRTAPPS